MLPPPAAACTQRACPLPCRRQPPHRGHGAWGARLSRHGLRLRPGRGSARPLLRVCGQPPRQAARAEQGQPCAGLQPRQGLGQRARAAWPRGRDAARLRRYIRCLWRGSRVCGHPAGSGASTPTAPAACTSGRPGAVDECTSIDYASLHGHGQPPPACATTPTATSNRPPFLPADSKCMLNDHYPPTHVLV